MITYKTCSHLIHLSTNKTFHWDSNLWNYFDIEYHCFTDLYYEFYGPLTIEIHIKCDPNCLCISLPVNTVMKPTRYLLRTGFRKKCHIMSFLFSLHNNKPSTNVGREIIHSCCSSPTTFFQQEFFTAFLSLKYVGKRKRAKDEENYIIPLTETILCEKLKALNSYQNKYFVCLSELKYLDIGY